MAGPLNLSGSNIEDTYQRVLQTDGTLIYDGTGSLFTISSSINTGSFVTTSSFNAYTGSNTSQFAGTASYALTSSFVQNAQTASYVLQAISASYAANGGVTQLLAGPNISLSPTNGLGQVTVSSTAVSGGFNTATGSYGSFYSTQTQTNVAGTARSMSLNTTDITNGISISGSTNPYNTYVKTENAGVYDIQFSAQVDKTDSGTDEIWIWIRKNGTDLSDTATSVQLVGNGAHYVAAWNFFVNAAAGDYFQLIWYSPDANVRLHAEPAFGIVPGIPSLIVTANRVDQFLSNTGSFSGSFTGSLLGTATTASYVLNAVSSSFATTASFATNALSASYAPDTTFPYTGSAQITGSLGVTGSFNQGSASLASGLFSHVQGFKVTASGNYSHAEGWVTVASGLYSHTEGQGTTANGGSSHAEGQVTTASGFASHAEGYGTTANGSYSHAEGQLAIATGQASHAEGRSTTASADYSHAEGWGTVASGSYQHVQGQYNLSSSAQSAFIVGNGTADGSRSNLIFASGSQVQVTGSVIATAGFTGSLLGTAVSSSFASTASFVNPLTQTVTINGLLIQTGSHAEGYYTQATGDYSHAEGAGTIANGQTSHAEGVNTIATGYASHAEGRGAIATGDYSHAEGESTQATGYASHAEGASTTADGLYSHAEGVSTIADGLYSHAEGYSTTATGDYSHAEGESTQATGYASHAEGTSTTAGQLGYNPDTPITLGVFELGSGYYDLTSLFTLGVFVLIDDILGEINGIPTIYKLEVASSTYTGTPATQITLVDTSINTSTNKYVVGIYGNFNPANADSAIGSFSHASGESTHTIGLGSSTEGASTEALGYYSHAEGAGTTATGYASHAEGESTQATGYASHAEGFQVTASGSYSHAEGESTQATGYASHAEGASTTADGLYSHAEGAGTTATGYASHAEGASTTATGDYSHAEGLATVASGSYQHVQGQYNISSSAQSAFIVGNGTADGSRSNLIFASGSQVQITGSLTVSGSGTFTNIGPAIFSGSVTSTAGFTGSIQGTAQTASYVLNAVSSSFAQTASFFSGTVVSASYAQTASFVQNAQTASFFSGTVVSASYAQTASYFGGTVVSASYAISSSFALSASWAPSAGGGASIYKLTSQTLPSSSWVATGSYYTSSFANANITTNTRVDFTPDNASYTEVTTAGILPQVTVIAGTASFYALFPPQTNITGEITIFPTV